MQCKIRPRGGTTEEWADANPVLENREMAFEYTNSPSEGNVKVKMGDGNTPWDQLPYALSGGNSENIVTHDMGDGNYLIKIGKLVICHLSGTITAGNFHNIPYEFEPNLKITEQYNTVWAVDSKNVGKVGIVDPEANVFYPWYNCNFDDALYGTLTWLTK